MAPPCAHHGLFSLDARYQKCMIGEQAARVAVSAANPYNLALFNKNYTPKRPQHPRRASLESIWHSCKAKKF
jgi:hypothetical protein